jgi:hypothetical protein
MSILAKDAVSFNDVPVGFLETTSKTMRRTTFEFVGHLDFIESPFFAR